LLVESVDFGADTFEARLLLFVLGLTCEDRAAGIGPRAEQFVAARGVFFSVLQRGLPRGLRRAGGGVVDGGDVGFFCQLPAAFLVVLGDEASIVGCRLAGSGGESDFYLG